MQMAKIATQHFRKYELSYNKPQAYNDRMSSIAGHVWTWIYGYKKKYGPACWDTCLSSATFNLYVEKHSQPFKNSDTLKKKERNTLQDFT